MALLYNTLSLVDLHAGGLYTHDKYHFLLEFSVVIVFWAYFPVKM
jgi:hypothetical protein